MMCLLDLTKQITLLWSRRKGLYHNIIISKISTAGDLSNNNFNTDLSLTILFHPYMCEQTLPVICHGCLLVYLTLRRSMIYQLRWNPFTHCDSFNILTIWYLEIYEACSFTWHSCTLATTVSLVCVILVSHVIVWRTPAVTETNHPACFMHCCINKTLSNSSYNHFTNNVSRRRSPIQLISTWYGFMFWYNNQ
jgi:hypothetical protein